MSRRLTAILTLLLLCISSMQGSVASCARAIGMGDDALATGATHARHAMRMPHADGTSATERERGSAREARPGDDGARRDAPHDCPPSTSHDACLLMTACSAPAALPASADAPASLVAMAAQIETTSSAPPAPSLAPELPPPRG